MYQTKPIILILLILQNLTPETNSFFIAPAFSFTNKAHIGRRQTNINLTKREQKPFISSKETSTEQIEPKIFQQQQEKERNGNRMHLLHQRLQACNVTKYSFVNDNDSTDQYSPTTLTASSLSTNNGNVTSLQRTEYTETKYLNVIHVKTLVWKGVYLQQSNDETNKKNKMSKKEQGEDDNEINSPSSSSSKLNKPFYFVTALRIQDKVDMKSLRTLVKREWPKQKKTNGGVLIVQMAERHIAEELTGFQSGSMPPGWHSVPMTVFIDDHIIEDANLSFPPSASSFTTALSSSPLSTTTTTTTTSESMTNDRFSQIIMSVGSGAADYSLHISLQDMFNSSTYSYNNNIEDKLHDDGTDIGAIIQKYKSNVREGYHAGRQICSFSRASVELHAKRNVSKRDTTFIPTTNGEQSPSSDGSGDHAYDESSQAETLNRKNKEILKALTRKGFNVAARKKGKVHEVKLMIERMGDKFPEYMTVDKPDGDNRFGGEMNKNALHYAAWKGDLETISLLINAAKERDDMDMDVVNEISTGEGNYGKTPIFYSITQCRDDAVLLLLSHGANLLIVNNKGQTPVSLAFNKLKKETCDFMFQMEEHQLKAGGKFRDYRETHSDGQRYGDIDPRFIRPGDVNVDTDILEELGVESNKLSELSNIDIKTNLLPRSVRVTTALMRQMKWHQQQEETTGIVIKPNRNSKISGKNDVEKTNGTPAFIQESGLKPAESKSKGRTIEYKTSSTIAKLQDGTEIDITTLSTLYLKDVLSMNSMGTQNTHELIDDEVGLLTFQFAVDEFINGLCDEDDDHAILKKSWGLDCEWRPSHISGEESPVAVLQLSTGARAFILDLQSLLQPSKGTDHSDLTSNELLLSDSLTKLFNDPNIRILGFGIGQDLSKLAVSFPHIACFRNFSSVIDLQSLSRQVYPGTPKTFMSSLQKSVAILLRKRLDKTEQCSVWDSRPLSATQLEYASLDATVLPKLFEKMIYNNPIVEKENGFFLSKRHSYLQTSYRFQILSDEGDKAYRVPMGSIKRSLDIKYARQIWPTFKQSPTLPEVIPLGEVSQRAVSRRNQSKEKRVVKEKRNKRNPIPVSVLTGDLSNLPNPGIMLGYTKESVIERVVRKQVIESLQEDTYLQYNRRGGIIELGNCFLLFVNFGVGRIHHKYRNEFLQEGRQVTFTINQSRYEDGELFQTLLTPEEEAMYYRKPVLFFIRASTKDKFMFCGKVKYSQHEEKDGDLIDLVLALNDFEALVKNSLNSDEDTVTYARIVASQKYH